MGLRLLILAALAALAAAPGILLASGSGGGGMGLPATTGPARSPEQRAESEYTAGVKFKQRAWRYEEKAAGETDPGKRAKDLARAQRQYRKAIKALDRAVALNRSHYQALNELGYALRKTGDYRRALLAYNSALKLKPDFAPAVEYRGEALLALERFEDVKNHYLWLYEHDTTLAAELMAAITAWLSEHPGGSAERAEFEAWAKERASLAGLTDALSLNAQRRW